MSSIGERLKELRIKRGMTQFDVGNAVNVSDKTVSTWENDMRVPRKKAIVDLSRLYNVSADWILGMSDKTEESDDIWPIMAISGKTIRFKYMNDTPYIEINNTTGTFESMYKKLDNDEKRFIVRCMKSYIEKNDTTS